MRKNRNAGKATRRTDFSDPAVAAAFEQHSPALKAQLLAGRKQGSSQGAMAGRAACPTGGGLR